MGITAILHVIRVLQGLSRLGTSETCAGFNAWDPTRIPFQKRHAMVRDQVPWNLPMRRTMGQEARTKREESAFEIRAPEMMVSKPGHSNHDTYRGSC